MRLFLTEKQIHQLIESARDNPRDYALLHLAASTAFRGGDLLKLTIADVMAEDGRIVHTLRVKMQKVQRWIERPLREGCRLALFDYLSSRDDENPFLFISMDKGYMKRARPGPMTRFSYDDVMKLYLGKMFSKSKLRGSSTHTLRRSVAKLVYLKTKSIPAAQYLLGHTSPVHTIRYLDPDEIQSTTNEVVLNQLEW